MSIYRYCGDSHIGKSHEASGTVCQDAFYYTERAGVLFAAVADGLGSSRHSDIASKMAAHGAVEHCADSISPGMPDAQVTEIIKSAFGSTNFAIKQKAGDSLDDYDTTLTLAVFVGGVVYYGHAGDSGIIALRDDGIFEEVTKPQLGDGYGKERTVYPLAAESHWVFGKYMHKARAVFLMTDGVLNKAMPPLLEGQEYKLDHAYLFYLYDNLCKNPDLDNWVKGELDSILPQEINYDDKTLVAVMCKAVKVRLRQKQYYEFPSKEMWDGLLAKHNEELYGYKADNKPPTIGNAVNQANGAMLPNNAGKVNGDVRNRHYSVWRRYRKVGLFWFVKVLALGFALGVIVTLAVLCAIERLVGL